MTRLTRLVVQPMTSLCRVWPGRQRIPGGVGLLRDRRGDGESDHGGEEQPSANLHGAQAITAVVPPRAGSQMGHLRQKPRSHAENAEHRLTPRGHLRPTIVHLEAWWADLRVAARNAARRPGFTLLVALTLALGLGVNSAVFALVDAVLLRPLPFRDPSRLVYVWQTLPQQN